MQGECNHMKSRQGLISVVILLLGVVLTWHSLPSLQAGMARHHWPKTTGTVVRAYVTEHPDILPSVIYAYTVAGHQYKDTSFLQAPGFGTRSKRREVALKSITLYPDGAPVTVYYDPAHPEHATLIPHPPWWVFAQLSTGLLIAIIGLILILRLLLQRPPASQAPVATKTG